MAMAVSIHLLNTFIMLAPDWMQVVNFFQADTGWVTYVLLASHTFSLTELEVL